MSLLRTSISFLSTFLVGILSIHSGLEVLSAGVKMGQGVTIDRVTPVPNVLLSKYMHNALSKYRAGDFYSALTYYNDIVNKYSIANDSKAVILFNRGLVHSEIGNNILAIKDFTNAIKLSPKLPHPHSARGSILLKIQNYKKALGDFREAIKKGHPKEYLMLYSQAIAYEGLGNYDQAVSLLNKSLRLNPKYSPVHSSLRRLGLITTAMRDKSNIFYK